MKTYLKIIQVMSMTAGVMLVATGCSSTPTQTETGKEIAATGPSVMNVRTEPTVVELNRELQPTKTPEVLADVKDFRSKVREVKLKFIHVPIQIPMENIGGTLWRAEISPRDLQMLAVSGKTIQYDATVEAKNESGQTSVTSAPITVTIKAPDLALNSSG